VSLSGIPNALLSLVGAVVFMFNLKFYTKMSMPMRRGTTQNWIPSIFNDFFENNWMLRTTGTAPAINVMENEKEYTVEVAAPGMTKSDFKIHVDADNDLTISMEKGCNCGCKKDEKGCEEHSSTAKESSEECKGRFLRREFSYSQFRQTLALPDNIEADKIEDTQHNGILKVVIPKKALPAPKEPKKIAIK
jgi:HSP20 family protein